MRWSRCAATTVSAPDVRTILEMNRAGLITANVTAMIEMEAQREDDRLKGQDHIRWIQSLGIARANIFTRPRDIGFSTPDFPDGPMFDMRPGAGVQGRSL